MALTPKRSTVVRVDCNGNIVGSLHGIDQSVNKISHVLEFKDYLYLGSPANQYLARVRSPKTVKHPTVKVRNVLVKGEGLEAFFGAPPTATTAKPKEATTTTTTTTKKPTTTMTTLQPSTTTRPPTATTTGKPATTPPTTTTTMTAKPPTTTTKTAVSTKPAPVEEEIPTDTKPQGVNVEL